MAAGLPPLSLLRKAAQHPGKPVAMAVPEEDDDMSPEEDSGSVKEAVAKAILSAIHDNDPKELAQCLSDLVSFLKDEESEEAPEEEE